MTRPPILSNKQIGTIDAFVAQVMDAYKAGTVDRKTAALSISRVILAVDKGNVAEINIPICFVGDSTQ
jgi:hypothetical protein